MALLIDPDAFQQIPREETERVLAKVDWLWANRTNVNHFPLGENLSRFFKRRVGKYRVIYTYDSDADEMVIRLAGLRDDIYKRAP